ncbi:Phosphocarrier protein HPr [Acinetobacter calcoaceticus]|nr:Phosphocarrier protein HPr [Acinetobacter calcoaceticus]
MVCSGLTQRNEALVMIDTTVDVINKLGLHARASGKLIEVTTKFRSSIQIGKGDHLVDAKNIMSLLMLGAGKGTCLLYTSQPSSMNCVSKSLMLHCTR